MTNMLCPVDLHHPLMTGLKLISNRATDKNTGWTLSSLQHETDAMDFIGINKIGEKTNWMY